jgi:hypothetical protein
VNPQILNLSNLLYHSVYFGQVKSRLIAQNPQGFFLSFKKIEEKQSTFSNSETAYKVDSLFAPGVQYRGPNRPKYDADGDGV